MSPLYLETIRGPHQQKIVCEVWRGGARIADDLPVLSGSVTDTSAPGVRRQTSLELVRSRGLFDLLAPTGTQLRPRSLLTLPGNAPASVPFGVFDIDSESLGYGPDGGLAVTGSDKFALLQRGEFLLPQPSIHGARIVDQIAALVRQVLGPAEPVVDLTGSAARVGVLVWEGDRAQVINDLAASIGAWFYFDRLGVATIAPLPTFVPGAGVWTVDAGQSGVLLDADRGLDRARTYNVVVASTEVADGTELFPPVYVWDDDPASPTYAGTDPLTGAGVGPFGIVPKRFSSPLFRAPGQALAAARAMLIKGIGLNATLSLTAVRNHVLDVGDAITVALPAEQPGAAATTEVHLVDKVTHPFAPAGTQAIETRATRAGEA